MTTSALCVCFQVSETPAQCRRRAKTEKCVSVDVDNLGQVTHITNKSVVSSHADSFGFIGPGVEIIITEISAANLPNKEVFLRG